MLTCRDIAEIVTDYLEGRLSLVDRIRFHLHLGFCRDCRRYLRQMRQTVRRLGKIPDEAVPPDIQEELLRRFRGTKG
jgi:predicted anti-sigma-YlaC factor YlaD